MLWLLPLIAAALTQAISYIITKMEALVSRMFSKHSVSVRVEEESTIFIDIVLKNTEKFIINDKMNNK